MNGSSISDERSQTKYRVHPTSVKSEVKSTAFPHTEAQALEAGTVTKSGKLPVSTKLTKND
jgi:hypothetical protein